MNTIEHKDFETERLILSPITEKDAAFLLKIYNSPKWLEYVGDRNIRTVDKTRQHIEENLTPQLERLGYSLYAICLKSNATKVGICGLFDRTGIDGIDVGFALLPEHEKKGYAYESTQRLIRAGFYEFGLKEIYAITKNKNKSSRSLLEKLGLIYLKTTKLPNDNTDYLLFRINVLNRLNINL